MRRQRRPVDATLWQSSRVPNGRDTAGRRRALGHGAHVRTGRHHEGALAGAGVGQSTGAAVAQRGQHLHVPQLGATVPGDQGRAHEDRAGFHLHRSSQRAGEFEIR